MIYKSRDIRWAKIRLMLCSSGWKRAKYLKKKQIFYAMGEDCYYHTRDLPAEPFLVKLHDDVRIAAGVRLITHCQCPDGTGSGSLHDEFCPNYE